ISNPATAIIPIADAADIFRKARGGRGDYGACRLICEQFEDQLRAVNHLPPASLIGTSREPIAPVVHRLLHQFKGLLRRKGLKLIAGGREAAQKKRLRLPRYKREFRRHSGALGLEFAVGEQD